MVRRVKEWENWTQEERMNWLRQQRIQFKGGRKSSLTEKDAPRVWSLLKQHGNISLVADLLGVHRSTVHRFLEKHPIPETFILKEDTQLTDYEEIQMWLKRIDGFAKKNTINNYMVVLRKFYEYMKEKHPERAKPSLWTSEHINEFVYSNPDYLWHWIIVPLRSLALKAQNEFPSIDLGLLPTKRTHKAKRSLAGKEEYYLEPTQIAKMIEVAEARRDKALIAFLFNEALRTDATTKVRIEDVDLKNHFAKIRDKGDIIWLTYGLSNETIQLLKEYLEERGNPESGWLFTNGDGKQLKPKDVNDTIKELGRKAGIEGKILTEKAFRKSFVKYALTPKEQGGIGMNPVSLIGTGKGTKTCFCVGWTDMKVLMEHYAPQLMDQIEEDRQKFTF
jgi:integrase